MQMRADVHDTPAKALSLLRGLGVRWMTHLVPFQCSASALRREPPDPAAVHARAVAQDTPASVPRGAAGLRWMTQVMPFHRAIAPKPTAVHALADVHDTASKMLPAGVGWMAHFLPFQRSARVKPGPVPRETARSW
jgi:hypothetical protein